MCYYVQYLYYVLCGFSINVLKGLLFISTVASIELHSLTEETVDALAQNHLFTIFQSI